MKPRRRRVLTPRETDRYDAGVFRRQPPFLPLVSLLILSSALLHTASPAQELPLATSAADTSAALPLALAAPGDAFLIVEPTPREALWRIDDDDTWWFHGAGGPPRVALRPGDHEIHFRLRGYMGRSETIHLEEGEGRTLFARLTPKTHRGAILRAVLFPGLGSRYMERRGISLILGAATLASAAGAVAFDRVMADRADEYEEKYAAYLGAVTPEELETTFAASEDAFDRVESARSARTAFLWGIAGAYVASVAEAAFFYPFDVAVEPIERSAAGTPRAGSPVRVALVRIPLSAP